MIKTIDNRSGESLFVDPSSTALVVVDVQDGLWPHMFNRTAVAQNTKKAVAVASALGLPIMATEQYPKGLGPTIPTVKAALEIANVYYDCVEKRHFSCFGEDGFVEQLNAGQVGTLAICGIEAHICVMQTALDALEEGYCVFCIEDAVGSRVQSHKDSALVRIREAGAIVGPLEMLAFELMRTAAHDQFKTVQRLFI